MAAKKKVLGYKEIYNRYKKSILSGALRPNEKVPSIRVLSEELGVAKKTVEAAYDILIGEGYLIGRGAKGTIVNPDLVVNLPSPFQTTHSLQDQDLTTALNLRDHKGYFRLGVPAFDAFPYKTWLLISGKVLRSMGPEHMAYCPEAGYMPLREAIANYVNISRGVNCTPEQIFITSGYKYSVALILKTLAVNSDKVVFEDPGYFFGQRLLRRIAENLHYCPIDSSGLDLEYFKRHHRDAKFVFTTPSHQSPLCVTLSLPRRSSLLEWAQKNKSWIVEDDYDGEFHYTRKIIPSLKSLDTHDRVIYVGTFSKSIMPSLRTSYIVVPKSLISKFQEMSEISETSQALLPQQILTAFLSGGHFFKHLKKMRNLYQKRRQMVLAALLKVYPDMFYYELTDGGMNIVAFLKKGTQDKKLSEIWNKYDMQVVPLSFWYSGKSKRYGLVIGFTNVNSEKEAYGLLKRAQPETEELFKK